MSGPVFTTDRSSTADIAEHLAACDAAFVPPLHTRVVLADYAARLGRHATRFEAWQGNRLVGLVAVYCNAEDRGAAFVSSVSVDMALRGRGIARRLMTDAIAQAAALGFRTMVLEVDLDSGAALRLYRSLGFAVAAKRDGTATMTKTLLGAAA